MVQKAETISSKDEMSDFGTFQVGVSVPIFGELFFLWFGLGLQNDQVFARFHALDWAAEKGRWAGDDDGNFRWRVTWGPAREPLSDTRCNQPAVALRHLDAHLVWPSHG